MTNLDDANGLTVLKNTPAQTESQLHNLGQAAGSTSFYDNANKTEPICLKQVGTCSILNGKSLKLMDQFPYIGSNISSNEYDSSIHKENLWTAIKRLVIIWKFDFSDNIKWDFINAVSLSVLQYGWTTWTLKKRMKKKLDWNYILLEHHKIIVNWITLTRKSGDIRKHWTAVSTLLGLTISVYCDLWFCSLWSLVRSPMVVWLNKVESAVQCFRMSCVSVCRIFWSG